MQFNDSYEETDLYFVLGGAFNYVPSGVRTTGDFAGEGYHEFWWRETVENDGYIMVWFSEDKKLTSHHTYRHPEKIFT